MNHLLGRIPSTLGLTLCLAFSLVTAATAADASGPAPAFQLDAVTGEATNLSQFKGQVVMLNFWATWCGPCQRVHAGRRQRRQGGAPGQGPARQAPGQLSRAAGSGQPGQQGLPHR
jgi:thiol-disulfide isomerase/thioredoxin